MSRVDFRVGRVVSAKKHPEADKLYLEESGSLCNIFSSGS